MLYVLGRLNLNTMTLNVDSARVYTVEGVPISVTGIAQVNACLVHYNFYVFKVFLVYIAPPSSTMHFSPGENQRRECGHVESCS